VLLWGYATSIAAFYGVVWWRTRGERTRAEPPSIRVGGTPAAGEGERWPRVSVIVPARDEERNIRRSVESLLAQDYPNYDVLVVDDASTDRTPAILREVAATHPHGARLRTLRLDSLPAGWAGKPHALQSGAEQADGEWLLFSDADTRHQPDALRCAVASALHDGDDLLSLGTRQELPDFWGRVLMPMAYMGISLQYPAAKVNSPESSIAIANGQYLLIRKAIYDKLGGYATPAMRATVVDDRDLAREVKRAGGRLRMVDGRGLVSTRMYRGLGEHWRGWGKNVYAGSRGGPLFYLLMVAGLPMVTIVPFALALVGVLARRRQVVAAGTLAAGATLAYRAWLDREQGVPWYYAMTHPLAGAIFTGILARGLWRKLTGRGVEWKGREYQVAQD
jgi:chlorobactene glucosyltransferase